MQGDPVQISIDKLQTLAPNPNSFLNIGGMFGMARAGEVWTGLNGRRLLLHASDMMVIFTGLDGNEAGKVFVQSSAAFRGDVTTAPIILGARRALPMARLVEYEMQFILGVFAASSGVGLVAVAGTDILRFIVSHRQLFPMWCKIISSLLSCRAVLKKYTPTLWDAMVHRTLLFAWRGVESVGLVAGGKITSNLPTAIVTNPAILGRGLGLIIGTLGAQVAKGRINAFGLCFSILSKIVSKTLAAVPGAMKLTAQEYTAEANELIEALRSGGVALSETDAKKIVEEVRAHSAEVKAAFEAIVTACRGG